MFPLLRETALWGALMYNTNYGATVNDSVVIGVLKSVLQLMDKLYIFTHLQFCSLSFSLSWGQGTQTASALDRPPNSCNSNSSDVLLFVFLAKISPMLKSYTTLQRSFFGCCDFSGLWERPHLTGVPSCGLCYFCIDPVHFQSALTLSHLYAIVK